MQPWRRRCALSYLVTHMDMDMGYGGHAALGGMFMCTHGMWRTCRASLCSASNARSPPATCASSSSAVACLVSKMGLGVEVGAKARISVSKRDGKSKGKREGQREGKCEGKRLGT